MEHKNVHDRHPVLFGTLGFGYHPFYGIGLEGEAAFWIVRRFYAANGQLYHVLDCRILDAASQGNASVRNQRRYEDISHPGRIAQKIGEEEWKNLHEIGEIIHVGDGVDSLLFQGRKYEPRGYENNRIRSFEIIGETQGIAETDIIYYDYKMQQVIFQRTTFGSRAPSILNSLEGLKFWLNNIKDCSSRDLPYEERFRIDQYTNIKRSK